MRPINQKTSGDAHFMLKEIRKSLYDLEKEGSDGLNLMDLGLILQNWLIYLAK